MLPWAGGATSHGSVAAAPVRAPSFIRTTSTAQRRHPGRDQVNPSIYIETSIVSYLTSRPSRDLVGAARQQLTHAWWDDQRAGFDLWISELVLAEAQLGDPDAAARRLAVLNELPLLAASFKAERLAHRILSESGLPAKAGADAAHIAIATVHRVDYLLTWNCKHIANPFIQRAVGRICADAGHEAPTICTPEEFVGG